MIDIYIWKIKIMPSHSEKQQKFFRAVQHAKENPGYGDKRLRKVADSMPTSDIKAFANSIAELKEKKAMLAILKDIADPMYLNEDGGEDPQAIEPVANKFHVKEDWAKYIKPYIGQPLSQKEIEAIKNYKEKQATTINRTEIWYKTSDTFNISHTTVIRKMKDSGQFSFTAFQKQENTEPSTPEQQTGGMNNGLSNSEPSMDGTSMPTQPQSSDTSQNQYQQDKENDKEDIIVTKSILFKDDVKGAAILSEFLKKLDL